MADGMTLLLQDGIRKIKQGITTIEEVISVATMEQTVGSLEQNSEQKVAEEPREREGKKK